MRIEFYRTNDQPKKLQWDLTHANYSAVTEQKSRAYTMVEGEIICSEGGFFLDPERATRIPFPDCPASRESIVMWMLRAGFFSPVWAIRIIMGDEEMLYKACAAQPKKFFTDLRGLLKSRVHSDLETYLESLRAGKGDQRFREMSREQSLEIANNSAKYVPRMVDSE